MGGEDRKRAGLWVEEVFHAPLSHVGAVPIPIAIGIGIGRAAFRWLYRLRSGQTDPKHVNDYGAGATGVLLNAR
ncbi:hypothetical protein GGR27_003831 [Lewinella antarctica]|uniref:Uncharacterized protein n=1 Tax=Neolewinella antarctica TaxID=442734 RepID=A0ABX0XHS7_9BACT|nr:hypothetical protein [Neolewinella antarctica]